MSDGLTDNRSQSEPLISAELRASLQTDCRTEFCAMLLEKDAMQDLTVAQVRALAGDLAFRVFQVCGRYRG